MLAPARTRCHHGAMAKAQKSSGRIRVGIGGWIYPPWRGSFYPEGLPQAGELAFAAGRLGSIEINGTFYRTPSPETLRKWHDQVPEHFVFALKAPRYATNRRVLAEAGPSIERFVAGLDSLGDKLGPINWQLAPTKAFDHDDIAGFLALLPLRAGRRRLRHALEVRHPSFDDPAFLALAQEHGVAVVVAGDSDYPRLDCPAPHFGYARIMGTAEGAASGYSDAALEAWACWARQQAATGRDLFLYVISGHKVANPAAAMALIERLDRG